MKITDLVRALPGRCTYKVIGIRPGEKLHESLFGEDEGRNAFDMGDYFVILPQFDFELKRKTCIADSARVPEGFSYCSDANDHWLTVEDLQAVLKSCGLTV
jgi:UDP-N-acetylglucosamine 4,6-dehydratase